MHSSSVLVYLSVTDSLRELGKLVPALPGDKVKVDFDTTWLEHNIKWLAPIIALVTIAAIVLGIFMAWKSEEMTGMMRVEYKRQIIAALRRDINGLPANRIAKEMKISLAKTAILLEELEKDRIVQTEVYNGKTVYRMRGIFGSASYGSH